ncbi:MAG: redox-sensing transcriptional repressor Rex [Lachnospiraceae bacterium]|nr:redox-sensing transcriptional repressor Rex [Lachnospiraceae bacterium]
MEERQISAAVIKRLPRYYRYLAELQNEDLERISSEELSRRMGVTASQIRQDLNNFGGFGQQGYGYNVEYLKEEIGKILGLDHTHNMIIIGAGNLGRALAGYAKFENRGFIVKGIFDNNPELIGKKVRDIKVVSMGVLDHFLEENDIAIATLAIPKEEAQAVAERLYAAGIRAIWNFAHVDLKLPGDAYVENVHLIESLMQLSYRLNKG